MSWTLGKRFALHLFSERVHGSSCKKLHRWRFGMSVPTTLSTGCCVEGPEDNKDIQGTEQIYVTRSQLLSFVQFVKYDALSTSEKLIHTRHLEALERGEHTYSDPVTGYCVFTRLVHLRRGTCCGSACRHCPYGHKAVPPDKPRKTYNSAFYI